MNAYARHEAEAVSIGVDGPGARLIMAERPRGLIVVAPGRPGGIDDMVTGHVAGGLRDQGFAVLVPELLAPAEAADPAAALDIPLLAARLFATIEWAAATRSLRHLPMGYIGAGTGASAALLAASGPDRRIRAIVACGGRLDLAGEQALARVRAPLRLIVGSRDLAALGMGKETLPRLACATAITVIPGAGPQFEAPEALDQIVEQAGAWFRTHLRGGLIGRWMRRT